MSDNENPIHAPNPQGGRPREGDEPRVSRTVTIDARTNRAVDLSLASLRKTKPHAAPGHVLDRMAVFCAFHGFDVNDPEAKPQRIKKKKPATVSTPSPAKPATSGKV